MLDATFYPTQAGHKTAGTSRAAAIAVDRDADRKLAVYAAICSAVQQAGGLTADEAAAIVGESILYVRPRVSELRALRLLRPNGEKRPNSTSGRMAEVLVWCG